MNLEHVAINVNEPAELGQWLCDNMGLRIVMQSEVPPYATFVADDAGSMIELYCNKAVELPDYNEIDPFNLHFAFTADDIEADSQRLVNAGAEMVGEITTNGVGDKLVFLRSPWNEPLQLIQRTKPLI